MVKPEVDGDKIIDKRYRSRRCRELTARIKRR